MKGHILICYTATQTSHWMITYAHLVKFSVYKQQQSIHQEMLMTPIKIQWSWVMHKPWNNKFKGNNRKNMWFKIYFQKKILIYFLILLYSICSLMG